MEFSNESLLGEIFPHLDNFNIPFSDKSHSIITSLYRKIKMAVEMEKLYQKKEKIIHNTNEIFTSDLFESNYVPASVRDYVTNQFKLPLDECTYPPKKIHYKMKIGDRDVDIFFILFEEEKKLDDFANYVLSWLIVLDEFSKNRCSKSLKINFLMTDLKKQLPENQSEILGTPNCNSAVTYSCSPQGEILVYRKQEWFKVFIHETFHSYGLDFSTADTFDFNTKIKDLFPIKSDFNLFESYTEFWASIINCIYNWYVLSDGEENILFFVFCVRMEQIFSLFQCTKILNFMGLTYEQLYSNDENIIRTREILYKEKSNIFAYYIVKALLLFKYDEFLIWCKQTNKENILKIENIDAFFEFIKINYQDEDFLTQLNNAVRMKVSTFLRNTMRMTLMEIS
tara:strand:+ start:2455 stop:3645 length:1191 start_codon:yes stop_codon:yes gene_type:complete